LLCSETKRATQVQKSDEPTWQSRTKPPLDDAYVPHRQGPTWAMRPPASSSSRRENSARHDKACSHAALPGNTTSPPPPTRPDMVDEALHLAVQPWKNSARHDKTRAQIARTSNKTYHHHRQRRQRRLGITDEQEPENRARNTQKCDDHASSRRMTNTQTYDMR
jgi:hypothetical protein